MIPVSSVIRQPTRRFTPFKATRAPLATLPANGSLQPSTPSKVHTNTFQQNLINTDIIMEDENGEIIVHKREISTPKSEPPNQKKTISLPAPSREFAFVLDPSLLPQCFLDKLPLELGMHIMSYLSQISDILTLGRTCKQMHEISNLQPIWKSFHLRILGPGMDAEAQLTNDWKLSFVRRMKRVLPSGFNPTKSYSKGPRVFTREQPALAKSTSRLTLELLSQSHEEPTIPTNTVTFKSMSSFGSFSSSQTSIDSETDSQPVTPNPRKRTWEDAFDLSDSEEGTQVEKLTLPQPKIRKTQSGPTQVICVGEMVDRIRKFYDDLEDLPVMVMEESES